MIKKIIFLLFCLNLSQVYSQGITNEWNKFHDAAQEIRHTDVDSMGNLVFAYMLTDSNDISYNGMQITTPLDDSLNCYVVNKIDSNGNLLWYRYFYLSSYNSILDIECDVYGNVYVAGYCYGLSYLNPDSLQNSTNTNSSGLCYIQKYNSNGDFEYVYTNLLFEPSIDIETDSKGDILIVGIGRASLTAYVQFADTVIFINDIEQQYVIRLNSNFEFKLIHGYKTNIFNPSLMKINVDSEDNFYVVSGLQDSFDVAIDTSTFHIESDSTTGFYIAKYDSTNHLVWVRKASTQFFIEIEQIEINSFNELYFTGYRSSTIDLDFSPTSTNILSGDGNFILRIDENGNFIEAYNLRFNSYANPLIKIRDNDEVLIFVNYFQVDFDFGPGSVYSSNTVSGDEMLIRYTRDLDYIDVRSIQSSSNPSSNSHESIETYNSSIYLFGSFKDSVYIDDLKHLAVESSNPNGGNHISKFRECTIKYGVDSIYSCGSYTWIDGETYSASNDSATYTFICGASNGCDSIVRLDLTYNPIPFSIDTVVACSPYTWLDGNEYTFSTFADYIYPNAAANGCDSAVVLFYTALFPTFTTLNEVACDALTWYDGITYTEDTIGPIHVFEDAASNGCDSIVEGSIDIIVVDTNVIVEEDRLSSTSTSSSFQWLNCDNGLQPLPGQTNATFIPTLSGNFAVEVTKFGCVDTSDCYYFNFGVGVDDIQMFDEVLLYPNPSNDFIIIDVGDIEDVQYEIYTMEMKLIDSDLLKDSVQKIEHQLNAGSYILSLIKDGYSREFVFLVE